jgi:hypothetical protein
VARPRWDAAVRQQVQAFFILEGLPPCVGQVDEGAALPEASARVGAGVTVGAAGVDRWLLPPRAKPLTKAARKRRSPVSWLRSGKFSRVTAGEALRLIREDPLGLYDDLGPIGQACPGLETASAANGCRASARPRQVRRVLSSPTSPTERREPLDSLGRVIAQVARVSDEPDTYRQR